MRVLPTGELELTFRDTDGMLGSSNGKPLGEFRLSRGPTGGLRRPR